MSMLPLLAWHIRQHGPIPTVRVSSAQARGGAKKWSYWGAVRYNVRLLADGTPSNVACERASSDRRSVAGAERDADDLADRESRVRYDRIGRVPERDAADLLPSDYDAAVARHNSRRAYQPRPLTLAERLTVRLGCAAWPHLADTMQSLVRDGVVSRDRQWITLSDGGWRSTSVYRPHGDDRDAAAFAGEPNQERRRRIYEACGERVLSESLAVVHRDDYGALYDDGMGGRVVRVVCQSTSAVYWLPVSPWTSTARAAVAETFGLPAEEYEPVAQA